MSLFGVNDSKSNTGTVDVAANGLVTGTATLLDTEARVGDYITVNTQDLLITAIRSNTDIQVVPGTATDAIATATANTFNLSEKPKSVTTSETPNATHGQPELVYGVDEAEIAAGGGAVAHTGWVRRVAGSGGRSGRVQTEVLVAGGITGDAADDSEFPDA